FSEVNINDTEKLLENRLENNGYFYGDLDYSVEIDSTDRTAEIDYTVQIGNPFRIATYQIEKESTDTLAIHDLIQESLSESVLEKGDPFRLSTFTDERARIDDYLKHHGYYFFDDDFILLEADTNRYADKRFDLYLTLKEGTPEESKVPYVLDQVQVFSNVQSDTVDGVQDTVQVDNIDFIQNEDFFKPERLRPFVLLEPGQTYNPETSTYTSRRLSSIGTYKFVNIQY